MLVVKLNAADLNVCVTNISLILHFTHSTYSCEVVAGEKTSADPAHNGHTDSERYIYIAVL